MTITEVGHGDAHAPWITLGQLIDDAAIKYGDTLAVAFPDLGSLTYTELARQTDRVAQGLTERGVRKGDRVASLLRNSPEQLLLWLGASKMGAIAVPINTALRRDDLGHVLTETTPRVFVVGSEFLDLYRGMRASFADLLIDVEILVGEGEGSTAGFLSFAELASDVPFAPSDGQVLPSDPACILFTGGTTGLPKATIRPHFSYICAARRYGDLFEPRPGDRHLSSTHLFHCGAQEVSVLGPLMHGIPTMLPAWFSASKYWDMAREWGATIVETLPSMMTIYLKQEPSSSDIDNPIRISTGMSSSITPEERTAYEQRFGLTLLEVFGMTETGTVLITNRLDDSRAGSVGRTRDWCDVMIAGEYDEELPRGDIGEICIRPTLPYSMSLGYFNQPEATVERWRNMWIHTGDLGYMDKDDWVYHAGRQAYWIRRRGENVSVEEVERVLDTHPAIAESAVVGIPSELGDQDIRAYVVFRDDQRATGNDLARWCADRLAYFKVPIGYHQIAAMPKSATKGDTERHKLVGLESEALPYDHEVLESLRAKR